MGSGGATLNALLVVTEHICARQGYSVGTHKNVLFLVSSMFMWMYKGQPSSPAIDLVTKGPFTIAVIYLFV